MRYIAASTACVLGASTVLAIACSPAGSRRTYIAPTRENVVSTTEQANSERAEHFIYVHNRSTVPVTVFSVSLTGCENVKQSCGPRPVNIRVPPSHRVLATRVGPDSDIHGFSYRFAFSWRADSSSTSALRALAEGGSEDARTRLSAMQRADSLHHAQQGARYNELTPDAFAALAGRAARLRADPDSLVLEPGTRVDIDRIKVLVVDSQGVPFGRTRWVRWQSPGPGAVQFVPPQGLVARRPGRAVFRFSLADEAESLLAQPLDVLEVPIVVAYKPDPSAPIFEGLAEDGESGKPLACVRVALEDSLQNIVARNRTDRTGVFALTAPRPGSYRVRIETSGWAPVRGPEQVGGPNEIKQQRYIVSFTEQLLMSRPGMDDDEFERAYPEAVVVTPPRARARGTAAKRSTGTAPSVQRITLGGSASMPILSIVGGAPPGTIWAQFVVDETGRVDTSSVHLPRSAHKVAVANVRHVLPHVRFAPAREGGTPKCELLRMQVNFTPMR